MTCQSSQPIRLHLRPSEDGLFTRMRLSGLVVTSVPARELEQWIQQLSRWSGGPVELVLPVDAGTAAWFDYWTSAISELPADRLQIRFVLHRHRRCRGRHEAA
jgi:hypothetical protein